jgi:tRNA1(Val) A37 N6-methylase TrmN6
MSLDQTPDIVKCQSTTRDAFLGGRLSVLQPREGFRAGLDSVLLGAAVRPGAATLLDLGAGVGVAALVAIADNPALSATLVEADAGLAALATANLAANGCAARAKVLQADVTAPGAARLAAGIRPDAYEAVIANPPFFEHGTEAPHPARAGARHMRGAGLGQWVRAAVTAVAPKGEVIFIHLAESLPVLLAGFEGRLGAITVLPLLPRPGQPASRVLVRGIKGSRAPLTLLASRALHEATGHRAAPEFEAILRGNGRLVW